MFAQDSAAVWAAVLGGHANIINFFFLESLNKNIHTWLLICLFQQACEDGSVDAVAVFVSIRADILFVMVHYDDDKPLRTACQNQHLAVVARLLQQDFGADVHALRDWCLLEACRKGNMPLVRLLLQHGANVHAREAAALRCASRYNFPEIVSLLIEHGTTRDENECALQLAQEFDAMDVIPLFSRPI